jgi:hypothetical protein
MGDGAHHFLDARKFKGTNFTSRKQVFWDPSDAEGDKLVWAELNVLALRQRGSVTKPRNRTTTLNSKT